MKTLAIDGNSLSHRAWHAFAPRDGAPPLTHAGEPVHAVHGFFSMLAALVKLHRPSHLVVGFDSRSNERKALDPQYKATRSAADPDLYRQMERTRALLDTAGILSHVAEGWEADDVVGSAATLTEARSGACVIATSDRDSFQLVSPATVVWRITNGVRNADEVNEAWLRDRYGVTGSGYLELAAMRGDASDNLPGVRGVGEKTAITICSLGPVADTIAALRAADPSVTSVLKGSAKKLLAGEREFHHNLAMMRIRRDIEIDLDRAALTRTDPARILRELTSGGVPSAASQLSRAVALACSPV